MAERRLIKEQGPGGGCVVRLVGDKGDVFVSDEHPNEEDAVAEVKRWSEWADGVADGTVESIYYIVALPETWVGGIALGHPYSGLNVKIGRTRNIKTRFANLQTGAFGRIFVHALEPGGSELEAQLHAKFAEDRRTGEWFACSERLARHIIQVWRKTRILLPGHWNYILQLHERSEINQAVRNVFDGPPDMVNPSLGDDWHGSVFVDLVNFGPLSRKPSK